MAERTEEVTEEDAYEDAEAAAAIEEARSVIDDVESTTAGSPVEAGGSAGERPDERSDGAGTTDESGGRLPSLSLPSPSLSPPSIPSPEALFSPRGFGLALLVTTVGLVVGQLVVPLGTIGGPVGILAAAFLLGLLRSRRALLEAGAAGLLVGGVVALLTNVTVAVATGQGLPILAVGGGVGMLSALLGAYFGHDLRRGLTTDLR